MKKPSRSQFGTKKWMTWMRTQRGKKKAKKRSPRRVLRDAPAWDRADRRARTKTRRKRTRTMARRRTTYRRRPRSTLNLKKGVTGAMAGAAMPGIVGYGIGYYLGGTSGLIGAFLAPSVMPMLGSVGGGLGSMASGLIIHG